MNGYSLFISSVRKWRNHQANNFVETTTHETIWGLNVYKNFV